MSVLHEWLKDGNVLSEAGGAASAALGLVDLSACKAAYAAKDECLWSHPADHAFTSIIHPSVQQGFDPDPEVMAQFRRSNIHVVQACRPCALDAGRFIAPQIVMAWRGTAGDMICLAHEAGHALQIVWSDHAETPVIARETCAFLAEIALLSYAEAHNPSLHAALARVWHRENATYFDADAKVLLSALQDPSTPIDYRCNYPLARLAAWRLAREQGLAACGALFCQGADAMETILAVLERPGIGGRAMWDEVLERFAKTFPDTGDEIVAEADRMVVDLSPNIPPNIPTSVISRGPLPPIVRCGGHGTPEDRLSTAASLAEGLALPRRQGAPAAPVSAGLGRAIIAGSTWSEPDPLVRHSLCGLAPAALGMVMNGRVDASWLARQAQITVVTPDGRTAPTGAAHAPFWIRWRSLGVLALAALTQDDAMQDATDPTQDAPLDAFLSATKPRASVPPLASGGPAPLADAATMLGLILHHLSVSPCHRQSSLRQCLQVKVLPPLEAGQIHAFVTPDGDPLGCVTWAWISEALEARLHTNGDALTASEWTSGSRLFFNDWITDPAGTRAIVSHMAGVMFPNEVATSLRRNADGSVRRVNRWKGIRRRAALRQTGLAVKQSNSPDHRIDPSAAAGFDAHDTFHRRPAQACDAAPIGDCVNGMLGRTAAQMTYRMTVTKPKGTSTCGSSPSRRKSVEKTINSKD